jgi:drug/metabolite transporter (DMT)-like permease
MVPLAVAALVFLVHAMLIREGTGECCREWIDAAWSLGLIAAGIAAWTWALHHEPFADPFSTSRRLAALAGLGALLVGVAMTLAAAAERRVTQPLGEEPRAVRGLRRSYEAIG